jgi:hypothetical protein
MRRTSRRLGVAFYAALAYVQVVLGPNWSGVTEGPDDERDGRGDDDQAGEDGRQPKALEIAGLHELFRRRSRRLRTGRTGIDRLLRAGVPG